MLPRLYILRRRIFTNKKIGGPLAIFILHRHVPVVGFGPDHQCFRTFVKDTVLAHPDITVHIQRLARINGAYANFSDGEIARNAHITVGKNAT